MPMIVDRIIQWITKPSCNQVSNNQPVICNMDRSVEDPYNCGWDNPMNITGAFSNVMEEYVGIVASKDGGSAGDDPYDCGWAAPEVSRQTATGSNTVNEFSSSSEQAEHSMRSVIQILHNIWPNNIHHNANGITTTAGLRGPNNHSSSLMYKWIITITDIYMDYRKEV
ncbi:hypothetical protein BDR06DRAFT_971897 [Suillus hirtellus]|nr:hypothetical protein BDR06DRAFT_971897 [Suillus hirtellus]